MKRNKLTSDGRRCGRLNRKVHKIPQTNFWFSKSAILIYSCITSSLLPHTHVQAKWNGKSVTENAKPMHIRKSLIFTMRFVSWVSFKATPEKVGMVSRIRMQHYIQYLHFSFSSMHIHASFGSRMPINVFVDLNRSPSLTVIVNSMR